MARAGNGQGFDAAQPEADRKQNRANDALDKLRRDKRRASEQSTSDVHREVLERATRENWAAS